MAPNFETTFENPGAHTTAGAIALPIFAILAILLLVVPFIWHVGNRNVGASSLIFYLSLMNLFAAINAIIWPNEDYDTWWIGTGLCDIEVKLQQPLITGVSCAVVCIFRSLAKVLDIDHAHVSHTKASKRRSAIIDIAICLGLPILQIVLHYPIQVNRYYIGAIGGCAESFDNSWPTIVIMYMWPVILSLWSCYYSVLVILRLRRHRAQFSSILASSGTNTSRFLRLFIMSCTLLVVYTPISVYFFYVNVDIDWISYNWDAIHDPAVWNIIIFLPVLGPRTFDRWVPIIMSGFVFVYFGMGGDSIEIYRKWMRAVGLGKAFPSLNGPRQVDSRRGSSSSGFLSRVSLISHARRYFDRVRKTSQGSTSGTLTTMSDLTPRKDSTVATTQHMSSRGSTNSTQTSNTLSHISFPSKPASAATGSPESYRAAQSSSPRTAGRSIRSHTLLPLSLSSHSGGIVSMFSKARKEASSHGDEGENPGNRVVHGVPFDLEAQRGPRINVKKDVLVDHD